MPERPEYHLHGVYSFSTIFCELLSLLQASGLKMDQRGHLGHVHAEDGPISVLDQDSWSTTDKEMLVLSVRSYISACPKNSLTITYRWTHILQITIIDQLQPPQLFRITVRIVPSMPTYRYIILFFRFACENNAPEQEIATYSFLWIHRRPSRHRLLGWVALWWTMTLIHSFF